MAFALRQAESSTPVGEICRKMRRGRRKPLPLEEGLCWNGGAAIRHSKQLEEKNMKLKRLAVDMALDKVMPQVPCQKW